MGTKKNPGLYDCLEKIGEDEPFFILRGQDKFAAELVRRWAEQASLMDTPPEKIEEAYTVARAMENWPNRKYPD